MPNPIEEVAKAICMGAMLRRYTKADAEFIERKIASHWPEYERDARVVMEVINQLVQNEAFEDAVANLPVTPGFLIGDGTAH